MSAELGPGTRMDRKLVDLALAAALAAGGVGLPVARRMTQPSADAAIIMDAADRLALFPAPTDAAAVAAAFGVAFESPNDGTRQTVCAGRPLQASRRWRSPPMATGGFTPTRRGPTLSPPCFFRSKASRRSALRTKPRFSSRRGFSRCRTGVA